MTRAEAGRGVHEQAWKETKNACLMTMSSSPSEDDPHPELPACFRDRSLRRTTGARDAFHRGRFAAENRGKPRRFPRKRRIARRSVSSHVGGGPARRATIAEKVAARTAGAHCVSSMVSSDEFGPLVAGEAQRRGFYQAARRAFLGDGQAWNWTLHETYFPDFVAITDFVHPLGYVYDAAKVLAPDDPWPLYLRATTACWQGRVADFLSELRAWQAAHPAPPDKSYPTMIRDRSSKGRSPTWKTTNHGWTTPRIAVRDSRSQRPMIESLIKEINYRVKGTEKFWNRPEGAEHILQIRAAALSDDDRLSQWILNRPGSYFYRASTNKNDTSYYRCLKSNWAYAPAAVGRPEE